MQDTKNSAKDKKSSLLYHDYIDTVSMLSDELAGKLFKRILHFLNGNDSSSEDAMVELAFNPIKQQFERDAAAYNEKCHKNSENQKKRWAKLRESNKVSKENDKNVYDRSNSYTNSTDTDTDTDTDITNRFIKQLKEREHEHASWAEGIYMQLDLKPGRLSQLLTQFAGHLKSSGKSHSNLEDFKSHFRNWLFTEDTKGRLSEHKRSKVGAL